ncbi:MAG: hypothetical protein ACP5NS_04075 [Candidatus Pacearchaeota archaeon]
MEREIGEIFLLNFLQSIATVSKPAREDSEEETSQRITSKEKTSIEMIPQGIKNMQSIQVPGKIVEIGQGKSFSRNQNIQPRNQSKNFAPPRYQKMPRKSQQFQVVELNQKSTSEKLNFLIKDPAVTEIECIGSEQNLLVKKAGMIQKTPVKLSIEEVYQLIAEFSQKTKIPVIDGTIKAAFNNLILTAVLSEMLGPRFILQKKNPFQPIVN